MQTARSSAGRLILVALLATATPAIATPFGVVKACGKATGHSIRDSALTVGRTVRDFFEHGPHTAKRTWQENAARTRADAHADTELIKREARSEE